MTIKLRKAPVYFALCQVRFNPILNLESFLPTIQESFRTGGHPDFRRKTIVGFEFQVDQAKQQVNEKKEHQYVFADTQNTGAFLLQSNSLSYQVTDYETFEDFSAKLLEGVKFVNDAVAGGLNFIERIGLRYLDAVFPEASETVRDYLIAEVLGVSDKLAEVESSLIHSFSETAFQSGENTLISRTIIQNGLIGFPPGLNNDDMIKLPKRFEGINGNHAILDTDAFCAKREVFDLRVINNRLESLRILKRQAFKAAVTPHAMKQWS